jgi:N-acetylneuraminic acid mutarotase
MKKIIILSLYLFLYVNIHAQNVGIGTSTPTEKLEVKKALRSTLKISSGSLADTTQLILSNSGSTSGLHTDFSIKSISEDGLFFSSQSDFGPYNSPYSLVIQPTGNIGIDIPTPQQKLDVNGAIKIGNTATNQPGSIRYNTGKFEGGDGINWKSFTQLPPGTLVASAINPNTALTSSGFSFFAPVFVNKSTTTTTTPDNWLGVQDFNSPEARSGHTAIWTGTKMIIWGGYGNSDLNTGGIYDPATDIWTAMSASPLSARSFHTAVWTGTHMLIWGGLSLGMYLNDGAAYNPATDTWTLLNTVNAPIARYSHTAIWTGIEMVIWGGYISGAVTNTGSKFNFTTNIWTTLPTVLGPSARSTHTAIWTGTKMIIWGGQDFAARKNDGAIYNNATNMWDGPTSIISVPVARNGHTAIWTGTEMVVWGGLDNGVGFFNSGGKFNPSTNTWTLATNLSGAPSIRSSHSVIWTGSLMIIYGGLGPGSSQYTFFNNGGKYNPSTNTWENLGLTNAPKNRSSHKAVWTGSQMVIFGGYDPNGNMSDNGRYIINSEANISTLNASALYLFSKD